MKISNILSGISDEAGENLNDQISAHAALKWKEIELRNINGVPFVDLNESDFRNLDKQIKASGLSVSVIASQIGNWSRPISYPFYRELEELKKLSVRMKKLGVSMVRIMSYPNDGLSNTAWEKESLKRIELLTKEAEKNQIILLHENCAGWG